MIKLAQAIDIKLYKQHNDQEGNNPSKSALDVTFRVDWFENKKIIVIRDTIEKYKTKLGHMHSIKATLF
jgi:hypothetical protein